MAIKKPGSKKEQEIENKNLKHKKGQIRTAQKDKDPEAPYSDKTLPKGDPNRGKWNIAKVPNNVNET